jgi:hypothetical protein
MLLTPYCTTVFVLFPMKVDTLIKSLSEFLVSSALEANVLTVLSTTV